MNIYEPTSADREEWRRWLAERPPAVREVAERFPPWVLFRMRPSGHRVTVVSYQEPQDPEAPVTMTIAVVGRFNLVTFERQVFGVSPEDLKECDLPAPGELVGNMDVPIEVVRAFHEHGKRRN